MFFSLRKEKNEKKPRTFRSIVCARSGAHLVGSRHVFAYRKGTQATAEHAEREGKAKAISFAPAGVGHPSRAYFPHGE